MRLETLLITQDKADWLNSLKGLRTRFHKREMAKWWCELNARQYPVNCPIRPLPEKPEEWSAARLLKALAQAVNDDWYLTLNWRADWCQGKVQRVAISELALIDGTASLSSAAASVSVEVE